jgi:hypothetical protein
MEIGDPRSEIFEIIHVNLWLAFYRPVTEFACKPLEVAYNLQNTAWYSEFDLKNT